MSILYSILTFMYYITIVCFVYYVYNLNKSVSWLRQEIVIIRADIGKGDINVKNHILVSKEDDDFTESSDTKMNLDNLRKKIKK